MASTRFDTTERRAADTPSATAPKHRVFGLVPRRADRESSRRRPGGSANRGARLLGALAASALFAAVAVTLASAAGTKTGGTPVRLAASPLGRILVDRKGITLYDFPPDKGRTSVCYDACAALWPPLLTHGKPVAGRGVRTSLLGTTRRKDGRLQVTYGGHPLYYFVSDRKPGETTGQGVDQFGAPWWVISPAGKEIHRRG